MARKLVGHDGPAPKGGGNAQIKALAESMSKFANGASVAPVIVKVPEPGKHTHTHTEKVGPATAKTERIIERLPAGLSSDTESVQRVLSPHNKNEPPAAGRALQLMRAQQDVEAGKGKPNAELTHITRLIREGGHKAAAGVPPERVREILQNTTSTIQLPGQSKDPDVRLINQKFEGPLNLARKRLNAPDTGVRMGAAQSAPDKPVSESKAINDKQVVNRLVNMVETNETSHIGMADQEAGKPNNTVMGIGGVNPDAPLGNKGFTRGGLIDAKGNAPGFDPRTDRYIAKHGSQSILTPAGSPSNWSAVTRIHPSITGGLVGASGPEGDVSMVHPTPSLVPQSSPVSAARGADRVISRPQGGSSSASALAHTEDKAPATPIHPHDSPATVRGNAPEVMRASGGKESSNNRRRLEGTLKLTGMAGQTLGEAQLNATEM